MSQDLQNIINHLLLHSSYINNVSFFHGKMGLVVAMYAYAKRYSDSYIEEYAWDLLQQVYDGVYAHWSRVWISWNRVCNGVTL